MKLHPPAITQEWEAPKGTIGIEISPGEYAVNQRSGLFRPIAELFFLANDKCECETIAFVQVVREFSQDGKPAFPQGKDEYFQPYASNTGGDWVDHVEGDTDPYYNADLINGVWAEPGGPGGGWGFPGSTRPKPSYSILRDRPRLGSWGPDGGASSTLRFETCAICIPTQEIFGCITWEVVLPKGSKSPLDAKFNADYAEKPTDNWRQGVGRWNDIGGKKKAR